MKCISNKICYNSKGQAEEALLYARSKYPSGEDGPVAVYHCPHCECFHLTSKGDKSDILKSRENRRKIDLQREAERWMDKYRKK